MSLIIDKKIPIYIRVNATKEEIEANLNCEVIEQVTGTTAGERGYLVYFDKFIELAETYALGVRFRLLGVNSQTFTFTSTDMLAKKIPSSYFTQILIDDGSKGMEERKEAE